MTDVVAIEPDPVVRPVATTMQSSALDSLPEKKQASWKAQLKLSFESHSGKTILRRQHSGPLMVQRPFYPEGDSVCHTYVLHPPGGIVGGDQLLLETNCSDGSAALVTTPGATKYYGSDGRDAAQHQRINVANAALEWMPQESIYFDGCSALQSLQVNLTRQSRFIGWDINCFGRPAGNHDFRSGAVCSRLSLVRDGKPLLHERLMVDGAADLQRISGMRGAQVNATLLATLRGVAADEIVQAVRATLPVGNEFCATGFDDLIVLRYTGASAEFARRGFVNAWRLLRPIVLGRDAIEPRIWAT
jgi:urease accessory protein